MKAHEHERSRADANHSAHPDYMPLLQQVYIELCAMQTNKDGQGNHFCGWMSSPVWTALCEEFNTDTGPEEPVQAGEDADA